VTISERIEAGRRERRVLTRVSRAAWRLEQAERERTWALVSARAEGISIRTLATAIGLSNLDSRCGNRVESADWRQATPVAVTWADVWRFPAGPPVDLNRPSALNRRSLARTPRS
jgi:hypothetical protein